MARKPLMPAAAKDVAYRGYLIRSNPLTGQMWIEKDTFLIAHATSLEDARATIARLVGADIPVGGSPAVARRRRNPAPQKRRTARKYAKNPARKPRGLRGGQVREISGLKVIRYGGEVDQIKYVDGDDGRPYKHDCGSGQCSMLLVEHHSLGRGILIVSNNDLPLWEDA